MESIHLPLQAPEDFMLFEEIITYINATLNRSTYIHLTMDCLDLVHIKFSFNAPRVATPNILQIPKDLSHKKYNDSL